MDPRIHPPLAPPLLWRGDGLLRALDPLLPPEEGDLPGPHKLLDPVLPEESFEGVDLLRVAGDLEDDRLRADVDDLGPEDACDLHHLGPGLAGFGRHLDQGEFAGDRALLGDVRDLDHVDELVQLFLDLLDLGVVPQDDDGHPAHLGFFAGPDGETLDVESPPGEESGDPGEDARPVLDEDVEGVEFHLCLLPIISLIAAPAGTIGKTFASLSILKSRTKGPSAAKAASSAGLTSSFSSTLMPSTP